MNFTKLLKILAGTIGTIVLGAIGSGVWERVLSPALGRLSGITTKFISSISNSYSNSIYSSASNLYTPNSTEGLGLIILLLTFIGLLVYALNSKPDNKVASFILRALKSQHSGWFGIVQSVAFVVALLFMMARQSTIEQIQAYSYRNMEIIRPYVGDQKYAIIRSNYFRMKSREDFLRFQDELQDSARLAKIEIPRFDVN